jgi:hypothetical protein
MADATDTAAVQAKPTTDGYPPNNCTLCNKSSTDCCAGCHDAYYCSKDCQTKDWNLHKLLCKKFAKFTDRPTERHVRAIYFPVDGTEPKFDWLPHGKKGFNSLESTRLLGNADCSAATFPMDPSNRQHLGKTIHLRYRSVYLMDGSVLNLSIAKMKEVSEPLNCRGPFLVQATKGAVNCDLDSTALKTIVRFFNAQSETYF